MLHMFLFWEHNWENIQLWSSTLALYSYSEVLNSVLQLFQRPLLIKKKMT